VLDGAKRETGNVSSPNPRKPLNTPTRHRPWEEASTLKLLLDEMYAGLKEYFETLGWEAVTAQEAGLKGARDKDIVQHAKRNNMLLVTQDQKPADLAELTGVKHVLISNAMIARIADEKIREKYPHIKKSNQSERACHK
jgi:predicted nuclease of predicted toxin-antitoxin system